MKTNKILVAMAFMLCCFSLNAQSSWDWGDCVEWFKNSGVDYLPVYAHPTSDVEDWTIKQTSPDIIVEYELEGFLSTYNLRLKIVHGYNSDYSMHYFKDVVILRDDDPITTFAAWDESPKFHPIIYREAELWHLYGTREFKNITNKRTKAAVALMIEFIAKWMN